MTEIVDIIQNSYGLIGVLLTIQVLYLYKLEHIVQYLVGKIKVFRTVLYIVSIVAGYYIYVSGAIYPLIVFTVLLPRISYTIAFSIYYLKRLCWVFLARTGVLGIRNKDIAEFAVENQESIELARHIRNNTVDREHMQEYYENEEWR